MTNLEVDYRVLRGTVTSLEQIRFQVRSLAEGALDDGVDWNHIALSNAVAAVTETTAEEAEHLVERIESLGEQAEGYIDTFRALDETLGAG